MDWRQANPARAGRQQRQFDSLCRSSLADFFFSRELKGRKGTKRGAMGGSRASRSSSIPSTNTVNMSCGMERMGERMKDEG